VVEVEIWRRIYSSAPGRVGSWSISTRREMVGVPRAGDSVELADGWTSCEVRYVTWCADGRVVVTLVPLKPDWDQPLDEMEVLVREHGWVQHGAPSANQGAGPHGAG
jgi:hypothetical protein